MGMVKGSDNICKLCEDKKPKWKKIQEKKNEMMRSEM